MTQRQPQPAKPHVTTHAATSGETLELPAEKLWFLERGEVTVYRAARPVEVWRAPCALDLAGSLTGKPSATFVCATDVTLFGIDKQQADPDWLALELAAENARLWSRIETDVRRDDDTFLEGALPVPGPWHFRDVTAAVLVVQGDPRRVSACLPRGVLPLWGTDGRYLISVAQFDGVVSEDARDARHFSYREVTPLIPIWSGLRGPACFIPELYPNAHMATVLGREIHGFPKRTARVGFHDDGGELLIDRRLALRVRWRGREDLGSSEAFAEIAQAVSGRPWVGDMAQRLTRRSDRGGRFSVLVRKRIAAPDKAGRTMAIDQTVRVPITVGEIRSAERLVDVRADMPGGPGILHGRVVDGWRMRTSFRFGRGRVERGRR